LDSGVVSKVLAFCFIVVRKLLRVPFRPNYGIPCPETLEQVAWEDLPDYVQGAITPSVEAFKTHGLWLLWYTAAPFIGGKEGYSAVFLHRDPTIAATVVWFRIKLGTLEQSQDVVSCRTHLRDGRHLHTTSAPDATFGISIADEEIVHLPNASVADIIESHEHRMRSISSAEKLLFHESTLFDETVVHARSIFDQLIYQGVYAPLKEADVRRLRGDA
jgi:hypothetical protein